MEWKAGKKNNFCIRTKPIREPNDFIGTGDNGFVRCKNIPPVETIKDAKKIAHRIAYDRRMTSGDYITIRLQPKGKPLGKMNWFHVDSGKLGRVSCRRGSMFGPRC